ncbi:hypothetical protein SLE2022_001870 [Rubroshorea leprosula]
MGDSDELHSEENKVPLDSSKKRTLKTPAQRYALEQSYEEHKFPTDEMKARLAVKVGLTEKQISSWFCHRRLKDKRRDEGHINGRQDHPSGVLQDRASGFRQDSCGSIKQGDHRNKDPREVESRGIYGRDLPAADFTYANRGCQDPHVVDMDDASSGSSPSLQDQVVSHGSDPPYEMQTSPHLTQYGAITSRNPVGARNISYKPSGYLKVKGEIENPAITAVKRQLGRHYREEGPLLGILFEPLPPWAFESPSINPVNEQNDIGDSSQCHWLGTSGVLKQSNVNTRYEAHNSRMGSPDSYEEGAKCYPQYPVHSDGLERSSHWKLKWKSSSLNSSNSLLGRKSYLDVFKDPAVKTSISYNNVPRMSSEHHIEGMRSDSFTYHPGYHDGKISSKKSKPWLHDNNNVASMNAQKNENLSRPSNLIPEFSQSLDTEERGQSARIAKTEKHIVERKHKIVYHDPISDKIHPRNEMRVANQSKSEYPQRDYLENASSVNLLLLADQIKGSSLDVPSSFNEDETAETTSSSD